MLLYLFTVCELEKNFLAADTQIYKQKNKISFDLKISIFEKIFYLHVSLSFIWLEFFLWIEQNIYMSEPKMFEEKKRRNLK